MTPGNYTDTQAQAVTKKQIRLEQIWRDPHGTPWKIVGVKGNELWVHRQGNPQTLKTVQRDRVHMEWTLVTEGK